MEGVEMQWNEPESMLSEATKNRLISVRRKLLDLHKLLLEVERKAYEKEHGRLAPTDLLPLVIKGESFAWLHPVSESVVRIDLLLDTEEDVTEGQGMALLHQIRELLTPVQGDEGFRGNYDRALQQDPAAVLAHGAVWRLLPPAEE